ncbi:MAG: ribosome biosis GTPase / thiamine phosphate phosphatase [Bacillota bacterium]|nr:ribosome biosis GTPase / thiamine phosphate phosphatase [Bacillota bacterium]MDK2855085.1 ribosome biosis GTPase / thiamine phosphate phosphatase [Bacillota bacterium]MDK2925229.1 ribosome biosis GTPase / thiamine phosphate phosphatase [Bacillota bacterium]
MELVDSKSGLVFRAIGGFFFVAAGEDRYRCVLKGTLKKKEEVLVGDRVVFTPTAPGEGVITALEPRRRRLVRPPVANVDKALIVFAVKVPPPSFAMLDRMLVQAEAAGVEAVVCLNKIDLAADQREIAGLLEPYRRAGYVTYAVSSKTRANIDLLRSELAGVITVLAGQSGVGKSSLLNALEPGLSLATGEVSERTLRGRHTTRRVELLPLTGGGWVADTPGFSALELPDVAPEELVYLFPELAVLAPKCRYPSCRHELEPGCAVRAAADAGEVATSRLASYYEMVRELRERRRKNEW